MCAEIFKGPVDRYIHDTVCDNTEVTMHVVHLKASASRTNCAESGWHEAKSMYAVKHMILVKSNMQRHFCTGNTKYA